MRKNAKIIAIDCNPVFRAVKYYSEYVEILNYQIVGMTPFDFVQLIVDEELFRVMNEVLFREMNYDMHSLHQV